MAFEFQENTTIELPDVKDDVLEYTEKTNPNRHKLIIELAAIHEGLTGNYNYYGGPELEKSLESWVKPYNKPILINHDTDTQPLGRVMAAKMDSNAQDKTPFVRLQIAITDPSAIEKVLDQRYMTGSVGGKAKGALCSICKVDWAAESNGRGLPCKHQRGKVYEGKLAYFELTGLSFKEYSFVNVPADQRSLVLSGATNTEGEPEGWIRSANVFSLDMNNESIMSFSPDEPPVNILENMRKKDAHSKYVDVKGTWLSVIEGDKNNQNITNVIDDATIDSETLSTGTNQENIMDNSNENEVEQDDITAVIGQLSDDLATSSEESEESTTDSEEQETVEGEESETVDESTTTDETTSEDDQSEGSDVEGESEGEAETVEDNESETEETEITDGDGEVEETEQTTEEQEQPQPDERDARIEALVNENKQLKAMLHKMLAERVVDKKIDLGLVKATERADALTEHATRSASSLADTLKDLHKQPSVKLDPKEGLQDLSEEQKVITVSESFEDSDVQVKPEAAFEEMLFNTLMGTRSL